MVGALLWRGMLVGIAAGILCFGFLKLAGEPAVDRAIAFEAQLDEAKAAAAKDREARLAKADSAVARKIATAEEKIATGRDKALAEIETVAAEAAADIVRRLTGAEVSPAAAKKAVKAAI